MLEDTYMYKIQYQSGQGKTEIISILERENDSWVLCKNTALEDMLTSRFLPTKHHNQDNRTVGYGQIVVGKNLNYITGNFEIPKTKEESTNQ